MGQRVNSHLVIKNNLGVFSQKTKKKQEKTKKQNNKTTTTKNKTTKQQQQKTKQNKKHSLLSTTLRKASHFLSRRK